MNIKTLACFLVILLGCLSIGLASWLETNNLFYTSSESVSRYLSLFKIAVINKNNATTSVITFGLWRYCIFSSSHSFSCSPVQINFDIDALAIMSSLHQLDSIKELPSLTPVSYVRLIPLFMASLLAVIALGITAFLLPGNIKKTLQQRALFWLTGLLCLLCAILVSIAFGTTFHKYTANIAEACSSLDKDNICSSYTLNTEIILLAISIGIFMISTVFSIICSKSKLANKPKIHQGSLSNSSYSAYADYESPDESFASIPNEKQQYLSADNNSLINSSLPQRASLRPPPPPLANQQRMKSQSPKANHGKLPQPPPAVTVANLNADGVVPFTNIQPYSSDIGFTSFNLIAPEDNTILLPPKLPFASRANKQSKNRPSSYGSNNTFGAMGGNSNPNSPGADDASSQVSSYMDYHQRTNSASSMMINNMLYASGSGTVSNHTLGGTFQLNQLSKQPSSHSYYYYNSSEEDGLHQHHKRHFESSSSSLHSNSHVHNSNRTTDALSAQNVDNTLFQRIDDYLHVAQEKTITGPDHRT